MYLFFSLFSCLTEPEYTLPKREDTGQSNSEQRVLPALPQVEREDVENLGTPVDRPVLPEGQQLPPLDGTPAEAGTFTEDAISAEEPRCRPVSSSKNNVYTVATDGIDVEAELTFRDGKGALLVEIVRQDPEKGSVVLYNIFCNLVSTIQYRMPKDIGMVYAVYFIDAGGDGPSPDDLKGIGALIDSSKEEKLHHNITLQKEATISPLSLPFIPLSELREYVPPPQHDGDLPPPLSEPEAGLPPPVNDTGEVPPEVANIEDVVVDPSPEDQLEELPKKEQ